MQPEQQMGVKFIGYSAFLVTPGVTGEDKVLAVLDFVSGLLTVPDDEEGSFLAVRTKDQLRPFLQQLQGSSPELQEAVKSATTKQQADVAGLRIRTDPTNGLTVISGGENVLALSPCRELPVLLANLLQRTSDWGGVLEQIEEVGRNFSRRPYKEFIASTREVLLCTF